MKIGLDSVILILFISLLTLLIVFALTYDNQGVYKDAVLTFISVFRFLCFCTTS
jgi:competence protein ComGC